MRGVSRKAELFPRAQELRAQGLLYREIADALNQKLQTVHTWFADPDLARQKARRERYAGVCERCGATTVGSGGYGSAGKVCKACIGWTEEQIIKAIQNWAEEHGGVPPSCTDWRNAGDGHPSKAAVCDRLGWNTALLRAGFELRVDRRASTQEQIEQRVAAGESLHAIADDFGFTASNIYVRMRTRGMTVMALRGYSLSSARLSDEDVAAIRRLWAEGYRQADIAERFGTTQPYVSALVNRKARAA